jgi:hypothetical protein
MIFLSCLIRNPVALAAVGAVFISFTALAQETGGDVQQMMTPDQFKAAGLEKLSADELQNLNKWLNGYRETTVKKTQQKSERQAAEVAESRVDGVFSGIGGNTIVRLEDGTVWKQANPDEHWRAPGLDHPAATVSKTMFGRKMQIAGMPAFYVDPVR